MENFCPLIKEKCKKQECISWKESSCLIFSYLELQLNNPEIDDLADYKPQEIPEDLRKASAQEIANKIINFAKNEVYSDEDEDFDPYYDISELYWKSRNIEKYDLPTDFEVKVEKAERIAFQFLENESKKKLEERIEKESSNLPKLINECVDWVREKGLKKITHADLDVFLRKKKIDLLNDTRRDLYSNVNLELKTTKS
ncbi:hypothetical protein [Leptospira levettii]|uniref:Trigger factor C-terminal domain-containing protein n=1 Tax=Leptospira levettii TaxID=2023178 RepID=A0ABY2MKH2_9LEPT|nr:hypothetical protein [Leptospira levettii]TGL67621.1 hypothetical protein EHQ60_15390 [Leptospira levettii]